MAGCSGTHLLAQLCGEAQIGGQPGHKMRPYLKGVGRPGGMAHSKGEALS
jgi:hypothetical protein